MVRIIVLAALLTVPAAVQAADHPAEKKHRHVAPHHAPSSAPIHPAAPKHAPAKPVPVVRPPHSAVHPPTPAAPPATPPQQPAQPPQTPPEPAKGSNTGLPLPRFASLKTDEVNLRSGPGLRYPIDWVYKRRDLPVEIQREFEVWRLITDEDGVKGWVHQATLVGRRTFIVKDAEQTLRDDAKPDAGPVARLKPGVVGRIRSCEANADWCQVQVGEYRGWLPRAAFWGTYPGEAIQ
jgi:SH3-like domain-containing protein